MTLDWTQTGPTGTVADLDSSNNIYVATQGGSISRRAASDGSTDWTNSNGTLTVLNYLIHGGSRVFIIGEMTWSGDRYGLVALNDSDGSFDWGFKMASGRMYDIRYYGGYVYACGDRI